MRKSENPSTFVPKNDPEKGQWFWIDIPEIAISCGLAPDTPLIEVKVPCEFCLSTQSDLRKVCNCL